MLQKIHRAWRSFRALPKIVQLAAVLFVAILAMLLWPARAHAGDLVLKNKQTGAELRLLDTPCSHGETLAALKEEWRAKFKNVRIISAKGFIDAYGCWIQHDEETVFVLLQDGSGLDFPLAAFSDPSI